MREPSDKIANKKFVTTYVYNYKRARRIWIKKLLRDNGRCKAAKKEFERVPVGSYKFVSLV